MYLSDMPRLHPPTSVADRSGDAATQRVMDSLRRIVRVLGASARGPARHGATGAQLFVLRQIDAAPASRSVSSRHAR
jgi:hypothetical protein